MPSCAIGGKAHYASKREKVLIAWSTHRDLRLLRRWAALEAHTCHIGSHTGHIWGKATGQVRGAVRAVSPAELQQAFALGTRAFKLLTTGGTDLEIGLDAGMAVRAGLALSHFCQ